MGVFNNFPYANFHELNADWIVEQVRKVMDEWEEYRTDMNLWKQGVNDQLAAFQAWFDNLDVQDEVRTVINELIQSGEFIEIAGPQIVSATEAWLAAHITPTTPAVDDTLSISGAAADAKVTGDRISDLKEDLTLVNNELGIYSSKTLDDIAFGNKTYRDIFITNNLIPYGDFENGLDWITTSTNNPVISDEAYTSKNHSLKCFGASSVQIRKDISVNNIEAAVLCNVRVDRYASGGGAGFVVGESNLINHVTTGFETLYYRRVLNGTISVFAGTASAANCDAYIDDFAIIDLTSLFGSYVNFPSQQELTDLYLEWIAIKNTGDSRLDDIETEVNRISSTLASLNESQIFVGAIMGVSTTGNRFPAMRQLFTVAQRILDDPAYQPSDSDVSYANNASVCILPYHSPAMYEKYQLNILYSKNGGTQNIPASTSKVMTLVTGLDYITNLHEQITIVSQDIEDGASSILSAGDIVTVTDLMYGMMLQSSNTCAIAFARIAGNMILKSQNGEGSYTPAECQAAFVAEMAKKAVSIGMVNSTFVSPSGRSESNLTTTNDLVRLIIEACSYPVIEKIWNKKTYTISVKGDNARDISLTTTVTDNSFENYYYIFGGKTGTLSLQQTSITLLMVAQAKG